MSTYKSTQSSKSLTQLVVLAVVVFLLALYLIAVQNESYAGYILLGGAAVTMVFWIRMLRDMIKKQAVSIARREPETKNWMYDLIKGENEFVFVAEVPGPEEKIMVRLVNSVLFIRGSGGFSREVPIEGSSSMQISDFKYRNGVLTLRIN